MLIFKTNTGISVVAVGRIAESDTTVAVSVPPRGMTKFFCLIHSEVFNIGGECPICTGASDGQTPAVTLITPAENADSAEKVS